MCWHIYLTLLASSFLVNNSLNLFIGKLNHTLCYCLKRSVVKLHPDMMKVTFVGHPYNHPESPSRPPIRKICQNSDNLFEFLASLSEFLSSLLEFLGNLSEFLAKFILET